MKDFNDFRKTLTPDVLSDIADRAEQALESGRDQFAEDVTTSLGNQVAVMSMILSVDLLEKYHDWLQQ